MTFHVPESKRSIEQNRFHFDTPDGKSYSMPKAKYLTMGQIETLAANNQEVKLADLLALFDEPEVSAAIRAFDKDQLEALMTAWQEDSGLTVGESSASEPNS